MSEAPDGRARQGGRNGFARTIPVRDVGIGFDRCRAGHRQRRDTRMGLVHSSEHHPESFIRGCGIARDRRRNRIHRRMQRHRRAWATYAHAHAGQRNSYSLHPGLSKLAAGNGNREQELFVYENGHGAPELSPWGRRDQGGRRDREFPASRVPSYGTRPNRFLLADPCSCEPSACPCRPVYPKGAAAETAVTVSSETPGAI